MRVIPHSEVLLGSGDDIFSFFRRFYETVDPDRDNLISISPSSNFGVGAYNSGNVSVLISEPSGRRWVSAIEERAYFIIDFRDYDIQLHSYSLTTSPNLRSINSWLVYGFDGGNWELIDDRTNSILCLPSSDCPINTEKNYVCQKQSVYSRFRLINAGPDSSNDYIFSLTSIKFFGVIAPKSNLIIHSCEFHSSNFQLFLLLVFHIFFC